MQFSKDQHEQIVRQLREQGYNELASRYSDWIFSCEHFPIHGSIHDEAALKREEWVLLLYAKERGITPH